MPSRQGCAPRRAAAAAASRSPAMAPRAVLPLAALLVLIPGGESACNVTQFSTQLDELLSTYDREWAPTTPVVVSVALLVRHATIDEASANVRLLADLHMSWKDNRVSWNASEGECDSALVSAERLWRPDVGALGGVARDAGEPPRARVSAAGGVRLVTRLDLQAPVTLDLSAWPRDQHDIVFKFASRSHFEDEIILRRDGLENPPIFESGAWELLAMSDSKEKLVRTGAPAQVMAFSVTLRRRAAAHVVAAGAVLAASALLLLAAALLPPAARPPICAAASFTAAFWLAAAAESVGSAVAAPRVLCSLGALCACGGAAAAAAAAALRVARCSRAPPRALRTLLTYSAVLRVVTPLQGQGGEESSAWAAAAQLLDALCVVALLLAVLLAALLGAAL